MKGETTYDAIVIGSGMTGGWAARGAAVAEGRGLTPYA